MRATMQYLQKNRVPAAVIAEVADFITNTAQLASRLSVVAGGVVGIETLLEHHGLLTPEAMKAVATRMQEKLQGTAPITQVPEQEPEQAPEQKPE